MRRISIIISILFASFFIISFFISQIYASNNKEKKLISPIPERFANVQENVLGKTMQIQKNGDDKDTLSLPDNVNILLLGFDGRKGDANPRCDAIQFLEINFPQKKIVIHSIPRGTLVDIPATKQTTYLGNSCHLAGIDFAKREIEKITGQKAHYLVKLGFSSTLGILRMLKLPTTETLMFLRNRRYGIGDNQRTYNQGNFIKNMLLSHLEEYYNLPKSLKYLIYKMSETDIEFEMADLLISEIIRQEIVKDPQNIEVKPHLPRKLKLKNISFMPQETDNDEDQKWKDPEFLEYQKGLENYLLTLINRGKNLIAGGKLSSAFQILKIPYSQKLWLQLEDEEKRNRLHFELLEIYALSSPDRLSSSSHILDFITEMELLGQKELKAQAEELLEAVVL